MKTITLSEEAYQRLRDWKESPRDSFSTVVLRRVPKRGTVAALASAIAELPRLAEADAEAWLAERDQHRRQERTREQWKP